MFSRCFIMHKHKHCILKTNLSVIMSLRLVKRFFVNTNLLNNQWNDHLTAFFKYPIHVKWTKMDLQTVSMWKYVVSNHSNEIFFIWKVAIAKIKAKVSRIKNCETFYPVNFLISRPLPSPPLLPINILNNPLENGGVLSKKMFLKIAQNSQENTCARVSFLIKLQAWGL